MGLICKSCQKEYEWINGKSKDFCCIKCGRQWKRENNKEIHICQNCGKEYEYTIGQSSWRKSTDKSGKGGCFSSKKFCSYECGSQYKYNIYKQTCIEKYGVENTFQSEEKKQKIKQTCLERYGNENYTNRIKCKNTFENLKSNDINFWDKRYEKTKQTKLEKYGLSSYVNSEKQKETRLKKLEENPSYYENISGKIKKTCLEKYGVDSYTKTQEYKNIFKDKNWLKEKQQKSYNTKKLNNSFNSSKPEEKIHQLLLQKFEKVERQYYSESYPFSCDFYIPDLDLYIEYQGLWTHGKEPFNKNNEKHLKLVELWKSKNSKYYNNAIKVWTESDPCKRELVLKNNLNWIEFFNLEEFMEWYNNV